MTDIPDDVMTAAMKVAVVMEVHAALSTSTKAKADIIARAIMAARNEDRKKALDEAAAKVSSMAGDLRNADGPRFAFAKAAAAILALKTQPAEGRRA